LWFLNVWLADANSSPHGSRYRTGGPTMGGSASVNHKSGGEPHKLNYSQTNNL